MTLAKVERHQLSTQVLDRIHSLIASGEYPIGHRLPPELALMNELGVGRSTVREAVQALAHAGILEVRQGSGTYVRARPSEAETLAQSLRHARISEVHEARRAVEIEIVSLAAQRRNDADLRTMRQALDERERLRQTKQNVEDFIDADLAFHIAVAHACGNRVLEDLYRAFAEAIRDSLIHLVEDYDADDTQAALHECLFSAIQKGNAEEARRSLGSLIDHIMTSVSLS
jgi:GntR family transcriptional repressor for pyruvate dehydrogenase complex